jgi:chemotaxis protein CheX
VRPSRVEVIEQKNIHVLVVRWDGSTESLQIVESLLPGAIQGRQAGKILGVVVDFENSAKGSNNDWMKIVSILQGAPFAKKLFALNLPGSLEERIQNFPLVPKVYRTVADVFDALAPVSLASRDSKRPLPQEVDALEGDLVRALSEGVKTTLNIQCSVKVDEGKSARKDVSVKKSCDVAATMGLMGKTVQGTIAIAFPESVYVRIMENMLGEKFDGISADIEDGAGELLNIIFGQAKKILNEKGYQFGKTLPSVILGPSLKVRQLTPSPGTMITFQSSAGEFYLEFGYRSSARVAQFVRK